MKQLTDFFTQFPTVSLATSQDQAEIFDLLERTTLDAGGLQISFDRRPNFFEFLKIQGALAHVFLMRNESVEVQGMACMSIRPFLLRGQRFPVVYASDLRTTPQLGRVARVHWRDMYPEVIESMPQMPEFQNSRTVLTAVWNDNELAQRALIRKTSKLKVQYRPVAEYSAFSVLGRVLPGSGKGVRQATPADHERIRRWLCEAQGENELCWEPEELDRSLHLLGKDFDDFLILEKKNQIESICLPVIRIPGRKVILKSLPESLKSLRKISKLLFGLEVEAGQELRTQSLLFVRHRKPHDEVSNVSSFLHHLMRENKMHPAEERIQIYTAFFWGPNSRASEFLRKGFLGTSLGAKIYDVVSESAPAEVPIAERLDLRQIEIGLL